MRRIGSKCLGKVGSFKSERPLTVHLNNYLLKLIMLLESVQDPSSNNMENKKIPVVSKDNKVDIIFISFLHGN